MFICFFFQAEDGIRDYKVTGVQTCALPISIVGDTLITAASFPQTKDQRPVIIAYRLGATGSATTTGGTTTSAGGSEIGRASCRERVEVWGGGVQAKKRARETEATSIGVAEQ